MVVYVDDMHKSPMGRFGRMKMSHMMADTTEELLKMADVVGVDRKWIQNAGAGPHREHFDISMIRRRLAVGAGAIELTMRGLARRNRTLRASTLRAVSAPGIRTRR